MTLIMLIKDNTHTHTHTYIHTLGLCIVSRYIECIDTLVTIWLMIYRIKSIDSHDMYPNIFLALKWPHKIPQSSVLLHFYQFTSNIIHIWSCQIYRNTYRVSVESINDTIHIGSIFRYRALIHIDTYTHIHMQTYTHTLKFSVNVVLKRLYPNKSKCLTKW